MIELHKDDGTLVLVDPDMVETVYLRENAGHGSYVRIGRGGSVTMSVSESVEKVLDLIKDSKR